MPRPDKAQTPLHRSKRDFTCTICKRVFHKSEHLRRHERSHTKVTPFQCAICDRQFARQDSLARHVKLHGESSAPPTQLEVMEDSFSEEEDTPAESSTSRLEIPPLFSPTSMLDGNGVSGPTVSASSFDTGAYASASQQWDIMQLLSGDPLAAQPVEPSPQLDILQLLSGDLLPGAQSIQASPHFFESLGLDSNFFFTYQPQQALSTQTLGHNSFEFPRSTGPPHSKEPEPACLVFQPEPSSLTSQSYLGDNSTPVQDRSEDAVIEARNLVTAQSHRTTSAVTNPSLQWLNLCLHMFWTRIIPILPILHRPTFDVRAACAPLLLNMVALGSLCLHGSENRVKGVALWRLVHKGVAGSWDSLLQLRGPYDAGTGTPLLLIAVLGQVYAMLSNIEDLANTSMLFHGLGFRWAKLSGLLDRDFDALIPPDPPIDDIHKHWNVWAARETQKRAILAHYIIDGCLISVFGAMPTVRHILNPLTLAVDDQLFAAGSATAWYSGYSAKRNPSISRFYKQLYTPGDLDLDVIESELSRAVLLEGIFASMVENLEAQRVEAPLVEALPVHTALVNFYRSFLFGHPDRIGQTARWHCICIFVAQSVAQYSPSIYHTISGRRAFLHANALRQIATRLSVRIAQVPPVVLPVCFYLGSKVFLEYIGQATGVATSGTSTMALEQDVDWQAIGTLGLDPTGQDSYPSAHPWLANGGSANLDGAAPASYDVDPFIAVLNIMGETWTKSRTYAEELQQQLG